MPPQGPNPLLTALFARERSDRPGATGGWRLPADAGPEARSPMIKPRQFARFAVVGLVATAIHVSVGLVLAENFGLAPIWANLSAFAAAILASCFGNLA